MNKVTRGALGLAVAGVFAAGAAHAQISDNVIKIGVLSDMSSLYTDLAGAGSIAAARMAVEDSGLVIDDSNAERVGVIVGSGIGGLQSLEDRCKAEERKKHDRQDE